MPAVRLSAVASLAAALLLSGCVAPAAPAPATERATPPPWPAPRDGVSYIDAAGLPRVRLDATDHQHILTMAITWRGQEVPVAAGVGVDRVRAWQAPVHTHDDSGQVWLEGEGTEKVTLAGFFAVWGVRFSADGAGRGCLGSECGTLRVTADGQPVADPAGLRLVDVAERVEVRLD